MGRVSSKTYTNSNNVSYVESYVYNSYGFLDQVKFNNTVVYDVSTMDTRGNITQASIGGTNSTWGYDPYGLLTSITATGVQNYTFEFERNMGNLLTRSNVLKSKSEDFGYDKADRLLDVYHNDISAQSIDYDEKGNIVSKSDAGTLVYDNGSPYQLAHVTPYTANFPSGEQVATYTSYGQVNTITDGAYGATFKYNSDKQRVKMTYTQNGSVTKTKYYFGSSYEKEVSGTIPTEYIWIGGDAYTAVAVAKIVNNGTPQVWSIFRDHLGSITHVKNGSTVQEYSYDAWGRRRNPTSWDYNLSGQPALIADRGFTGHEHLTEFGLINMNGRLYDPLVGRFLSPDNYVQDASNSQNFNRYGYCLNNPLRYTDPDGELIWIIPNIGWSKEGGFSIGLSVVLGIPGGLSAQAGFGYNFGSNDAYGYVGATAAMNTVSASYSSNSGGSIGYTAGTSPFSGLPISTNFGTIGVNYNITHNSMSGNISAWQLDQNGWTFNPSVSVMVFPEQTTNLVRGQGFRNNDAVLSRFVAAGNHKGALDYFGFEGSYVAEDGVGSFWFNNNDPSKCGIRYRNNDFDSYGSLYSTYIKESFHMKRFEKGSFELGNSGVFSVDRWPEERQGIIRQYKTSGLHGDKTNFLKSIGNAENKINTYNTYGDYNPVYQFQSYTPRWWHLIYKIPRRW